jgi:hypothetical protein
MVPGDRDVVCLGVLRLPAEVLLSLVPQPDHVVPSDMLTTERDRPGMW